MEAAVLTLLGVVLTASVTLVGLLLKRSVDERTLVIAAQTEDSRKAEQRRLQLDAAARAVQMLSLPDGSPASVAQASSALLVLAELGESGLALSLVRELWPKGQISSSAAVRVIDDALAGAPEVQRTAANALLANVTRLDVGDHLSEWPSRFEQWDSRLDTDCRYALALTLTSWLHKRPATSSEDWRLRLLQQARSIEIERRFEQLPAIEAPPL